MDSEATPEPDVGPQDDTALTEAFVEETTEAPLDDCDESENLVDTFTFFWFFYSLIVVFGLGFIIRRKALRLKCCYGKPGFLQPIDFIEETGRRWAYAAVFVIVSYDIINLFMGDSFWPILPKQDKEWMKKFGWVRVFTKLLDALSVCLVHYPLLAFVDHRRSIIANIFGVIHVIPWIGLYSKIFDDCRLAEKKKKHDTIIYLTYAAMYIAYFVVGFSYVLDFGLNVHRWRKQRASVHAKKLKDILGDNRRYKTIHHFEYVYDLLRKREKIDAADKDKGIKLKLKEAANRAKYEKILGFRYSTRIICCIAICSAILIWFVIFAIWIIDGFMDLGIGACKELKTAIEAFFGNIDFLEDLCSSVIVVKILAHVSSALSAFLVIVMLIHTLVTYKRRWHQLIRGDHSWHIYGNKINAPPNTLLSALKYSGFQVAFAIWGWVVLTFFLFIALMFASFAFIIPLRNGVRNWLIWKLINIWPTLLLGIIIIPLIQRLICRFVFLQDKGAVMALTNRRIYNAASYYFLVLNIIVGVFACLKRILIPLGLGILFLSRLDQPLIMHGYESMDPGYVAFVSMLLVDLHHNHPVLKVFVELLIQAKDNQPPTIEDKPDAAKMQERRRSKQIRNRWMKLVTLSNNPSLALKALEQRLIFERDQASKQISQDAIKIEDAWKLHIDSSILHDEKPDRKV